MLASGTLANQPGMAFAVSNSVGDTWKVYRTTTFGAIWENLTMPACPPAPYPSADHMEGDAFVTPNGHVIVTMNSPTDALLRIWKSADGLQPFNCIGTLENQQGTPGGPTGNNDRMFGISSSLSPTILGVCPKTGEGYMSRISSGVSALGGSLGHTTWTSLLSVDGSWFNTDPHVHVAAPGAIPLLHDQYLNAAKPLAQGYGSGTQLVTLSSGALYSPYDIAWTRDGLNWCRPENWQTFPPYALESLQTLPPLPVPFPISDYQNGYGMWDASSAGVLFAVRQHNTTTGWEINYKWYDGTWHDGGAVIHLAAEPAWSAFEASDHAGAVKSFGSLLGILTRDGTKDILIRIPNATSASPVPVIDLLGDTVNAERFPNLVFDRDGRAIATFGAGRVAYALTP
jgi:hypothetical protein